jgi:cobalamin-dependent methionine synthase I
MTDKSVTLIGDRINNAYGRAYRAFVERDVSLYQDLAKAQTGCGAAYLNLNVGSTAERDVSFDEALACLDWVVPDLQAGSDVPLCFDSPSFRFQEKALSLYERGENNKPIVNSVAASREQLDELIGLVRKYDTKVIVMAAEKFLEGGGYERCRSAKDIYETAKIHVGRLVEDGDRGADDIIIDPGLMPIASDAQGFVLKGLDAMRLIRADRELRGIHIMVGLSNFSFGGPKSIQCQLEKAYLSLAVEAGLDYVLGNPEIDLKPLPAQDPFVVGLRGTLEVGRVIGDEAAEDAYGRQVGELSYLLGDQAGQSGR